MSAIRHPRRPRLDWGMLWAWVCAMVLPWALVAVVAWFALFMTHKGD